MIVPEPCGYAVLLLISNIQKNRALRPDKKTAYSSWYAAQRPPNQPARTRPRSSPGNNKGERGGRRRRGKERKREREKEREREKRGSRAESIQPSRLSSSWWRHYRLLAICDLERHPISYHSLPPHKLPSQAGRPDGVLYRHVEVSVRAHRERQLPSRCLL